ncbi:hypothetical protein A3K64_04330 [Candidatus Micrarchaeota archaeon RBG_16_36_9]|nr:MAG: hypothetical protein A3K64_04330 [Candidatus Micrarchaeota archaeon RBG_16_36_9]
MCDCEVIGIIDLIRKKVENGEKLSEKLFRETIKEYDERWKDGVLYEVVENGARRRIDDPEEYRKFDEMIKSQSREPPVIKYVKKRMGW